MAAFDKLIHERSRLLILTYLAGSDKKEASFGELQKALDFTPGNLSVQLKKLQQAHYVTIRKTFRDNKPHTTAAITPAGSEALDRYLDEMEGIIKALRR
mgnify:CR=1 FL=1